jgi:succinylarginine dihydrolase
VASSGGPVRGVRYLDLRDSMENGGGPACLRQRIVLTAAERAAVTGRVFWDEALGAELEGWVGRHYRDRVAADDLRDPLLHREGLAALDELTRILRLGPLYDFQA